MSDNFHLTLRGEKKEHLRSAIGILLSSNYINSKVTHYSLKQYKPDNKKDCDNFSYSDAPESTYMTFYCTEDEGIGNIVKLPFVMKDQVLLTDLIWGWLKTVDYPEELYHDGYYKEKGFIITTGNTTGHCFGSFYSVFTIAPDWQLYGK